MKLIATIKTDDEDRLFAVLDEDRPHGLSIEVVTDNGDTSRPFRDQVSGWAKDNGHTITRFNMEGLN